MGAGAAALGRALEGGAMHNVPLIAGFWIAQADVLYALISTSLLLAVVLLVLRPGNR